MMHYVIVAKSAEDRLQYFSGDGFKPNLLMAARFRTEKHAQRRCEKSIYCRRMKESGAHIVNSGDKLVENQRFDNGHWVGWDGMVRPRGSSLPACSPP
jgi:hypothetical protein